MPFVLDSQSRYAYKATGCEIFFYSRPAGSRQRISEPIRQQNREIDQSFKEGNMPKTTSVILVTIALLVFALSCERTKPDVGIDSDAFAELQNIPIEYGDLVAVTSMAEYPNWVQLWFQDGDGVIRMVRIQFISDLMLKDVKIIARN
jgi:hypothetical protein